MYFIAIVLPASLDAEILKFKQIAFNKWGCKVGLKSPAHITIVPPFWLDEAYEKPLITDIDFITLNNNPFDIDTNNFSAFKPRTIFIDIIQNAQLSDIKKKATIFFQQNNFYKVKTDNRPFHPHISIATRDLRKSSFYEAWEIFKEQAFVKTFHADGLTLLKHNKKNWDVFYTSQFQKKV